MYLITKLSLKYCYVNGIGTGINKGKGFELCNQAAVKKDNNTQNILNKITIK